MAVSDPTIPVHDLPGYPDVSIHPRGRRDGTPPRCAVCGTICHPDAVLCGGSFGPFRCSDHIPRLKGRDALRTRAAGQRSRQAQWKAERLAEERQRREVAPLAEAVPVSAPRGLRERIYDRLKAKGLV